MKGRPVGSIIRNRIAVILKNMNIGYGYEIYKIYKNIFGNIHIRTIYYNLKKGIEKEEIILLRIEKEMGKYSWGNEVEKIYYIVGPYANISLPYKEIELIKNSLKNYEKKDINMDWGGEIKILADSLKKDIDNYTKKFNVLSNQGKKMDKLKINKRIEKLKDYANSKISKDKLNDFLKDINPLPP
ncbi:MAG: hypothetical protein PHT91_00790 [Candidatus Nanoarchaeia archaeon]|nr:hypothetical protein [Candidatus Nanoarchaeia archaeon]MDD5054500.1 hypothetical protein [Candidatus Nanoarchaeia archaeon]MDD5499396.1 hypothetical protein [Candidatus Nanoarchaeia archaeon]